MFENKSLSVVSAISVSFVSTLKLPSACFILSEKEFRFAILLRSTGVFCFRCQDLTFRPKAFRQVIEGLQAVFSTRGLLRRCNLSVFALPCSLKQRSTANKSKIQKAQSDI